MDFATIFHAVESVLTFLIIGCIGYCLARRHWFSRESNVLFAKLIMTVALPPYLIYNITTVMTRDELIHLAYGLVVPFLSIVFAMFLSFGANRLFNIPVSRRGIVSNGFSFSNTIYIGLPVNLALFGEKALPFVMIYYFANTSLFWTVGNYLLAIDVPGDDRPTFSLATLKKIISPPTFSCFIGLALVMLEIRLPEFLANTARFLGGMTTPLVILSIGVAIQELGFSRIRLNRELLLIMAARFIISPLAVVLLSFVFPMPELMFKVFIIQSSLPAMSSLAMLAVYYRNDAEFAAVTVSATTMMAIVTIPAFMALGSALG